MQCVPGGAETYSFCAFGASERGKSNLTGKFFCVMVSGKLIGWDDAGENRKSVYHEKIAKTAKH